MRIWANQRHRGRRRTPAVEARQRRHSGGSLEQFRGRHPDPASATRSRRLVTHQTDATTVRTLYASCSGYDQAHRRDQRLLTPSSTQIRQIEISPATLVRPRPTSSGPWARYPRPSRLRPPSTRSSTPSRSPPTPTGSGPWRGRPVPSAPKLARRAGPGRPRPASSAPSRRPRITRAPALARGRPDPRAQARAGPGRPRPRPRRHPAEKPWTATRAWLRQLSASASLPSRPRPPSAQSSTPSRNTDAVSLRRLGRGRPDPGRGYPRAGPGRPTRSHDPKLRASVFSSRRVSDTDDPRTSEQAALGPVLDAILRAKHASLRHQHKALAQAAPLDRKLPPTPEQAQAALGPVPRRHPNKDRPQPAAGPGAGRSASASTLLPARTTRPPSGRGPRPGPSRRHSFAHQLERPSKNYRRWPPHCPGRDRRALGPMLEAEQNRTTIMVAEAVLARAGAPEVAEAFARAIAVTPAGRAGRGPTSPPSSSS